MGMRTMRTVLALVAVALIGGLVAALTAVPSGATSGDKPSLSWANGAGTGTVELPAPVLAPGDVVTRRLIVINPSPEPVVASLSVSSVGDDALARVLDVDIRSGVRDCVEPTAAHTGTIEAAGTAAATELGPLRLRPSNKLRLCVRVTMRLDADDSVQGLSATTTFHLVATQGGSDPAP